MDNLCHTLVGAACGEAGLKHRTRFGIATLMIASNLPDLDVLVFATSVPAVAFRRGWTHGVLAQVLLPLLLTAVTLAVARWLPRRASAPAVHAGWLLLFAYLGVGAHVLLDYLNTYGIRLLAPLDWQWFYGDAVFIIDPWLWIALGGGVLLARWQHTPRPARAALLFTTTYIAVLILSAVVARDLVAGVWRDVRGTEPRAIMVGPVPLSPFTRDVIVDAGAHYETGSFSWWSGAVTFDPDITAKNQHDPEIARAVRQSSDMRGFLVWSRFPFWTLHAVEGGTRVTVEDMRFMATSGRFGASTVVAGAGADPP